MLKTIKEWVWWNSAEITAVVVVLCIVAMLLQITVNFEQRKCYRAYAQFQPEYVGMITGCMITVDEQRVPAESLRMTL